MLAQLQGAWFYNAQLQGASLNYTLLQGAFLDGAQLQGASLNKAQLQGAWLDYAQLQGASFVGVCAWRADARQATWKDTRVAHPETGPKADKASECDWPAPSFAELKQRIAVDVPEGDKMRADMEGIGQRLDPAKALEGENEMGIGPLAKARRPRGRPMRKASPGNGASWAAPPRVRPTCFMH